MGRAFVRRLEGRHSVLAMLFLALAVECGCTLCISDRWPEVTVPKSPKDDKEMLISHSLRRAVIEERDIPGYDRLENKDRIVICSEMLGTEPREHFSPGALPISDRVAFMLLSPEEIRRLGFCKKGFVYLYVSYVTISESTATLELVVSRAPIWKDRGEFHGSWAGGYELLYSKRDGEWTLLGTERIHIH
jgi:hypothetical protein